jgi:hypothetical protein
MENDKIMKNASVWFAVLSSVTMAACVADAPGDEQDLGTDVTAQAVSTYNQLKNKAWSQCMDAPGGVLNVTLKLTNCSTTSTTQHWASVPTGATNTYFLVNQNSGLCAEVNNGTATPGERVDEFTCNGSTAEQWVRADVVIGGISYAQFTHAGTSQCLDTVSSTGSNLMQWTCASLGSNDAQLWRVQ